MSHKVPCFLFISLVFVVVSSSEDLYQLLGVSKSASNSEIKNSYRKQARLWHPDKNKAPDARDMFTKINEAYEVLSDTKKRRRYDLTGEIGVPPSQVPQSRQGFRFSQGGFQFFFNSGPSHRSDGINTYQFYNEVLPQSHHKPFLLSFYTDFCMQCSNVETLWNSIRKDMAALGVELRSVHANRHHRVSQYCGISHVPAITGVLSGRVNSFFGLIKDKHSILNFLDNILPKMLITMISEDNIDGFLSESIQRNRPRVVLFSPRDTPSLLYKVTAFVNQKTIDFGYVSSKDNISILERFGLFRGEKRLAVFKEYSTPSLLTVGHLDQRVLQTSVERLTLNLPRLSSPSVFNNVCPLSGESNFCVILLVPDSSAYNDSLTAAFREVVSDNSVLDRFAYIDASLQSEFLSPLDPPKAQVICPHGVQSRPVLIVRPSKNIYDWFDHFCETRSLLSHLDSLRLRLSSMSYLPVLSELRDEEAPGLFLRLWNTLSDFALDLSGFVLALDSGTHLPLLSLLSAVVVLCMVWVCLGVTSAEENITRSTNSKSIRTTHRTRAPKQPPHIEELNEESYKQLVHGDQPAITLIVLINIKEEYTGKTVKKFLNIVSCYKSYKLKVYYLCYASNTKWLKNLLNQCPGLTNEDIRKRELDCLSGQVTFAVALLNTKKQICLFPDEYYSREETNSDNTSLSNGLLVSRATKVPQNMEGFDNWMERFADGTLKRYRVTDWPKWSS